MKTFWLHIKTCMNKYVRFSGNTRVSAFLHILIVRHYKNMVFESKSLS